MTSALPVAPRASQTQVPSPESRGEIGMLVTSSRTAGGTTSEAGTHLRGAESAVTRLNSGCAGTRTRGERREARGEGEGERRGHVAC